MQYTIQNKRFTVTADTCGAELVSVVCDGQERLWQNDNGSWSGHAPLLFPVCGHCDMRVDGKTYPITKHGFARRCEFKAEACEENLLRFSLRADAQTPKVYPFDFVLTVTYTLCENAIMTTVTVENPSDKPLFYFCGGHDSFALAGDVDEYKVVFAENEKLEHLVHNENGYLTGEIQPLGAGKEICLPADYLQGDNTLIFGDIASRAVQLCKRSGEPVAELSFTGFENLLLWRPKGAHMICIEPWGNLPDACDMPPTEFSHKKGVQEVPAHSSRTHTLLKRYY